MLMYWYPYKSNADPLFTALACVFPVKTPLALLIDESGAEPELLEEETPRTTDSGRF